MHTASIVGEGYICRRQVYPLPVLIVKFILYGQEIFPPPGTSLRSLRRSFDEGPGEYAWRAVCHRQPRLRHDLRRL